MARNHDGQTPVVRESETAPLLPGVPVVRLKIRLDYFPQSGELDYSVIAWDHPGGKLLANEIWATYDRWHAGLAPADLVAIIVGQLRLEPDPF